MKKKNCIGILLAIFFILVTSSISNIAGNQINQSTSTETTTANPKTSSCDIESVWNYTTGLLVNDVAVSGDGKYIAIVESWNITLFSTETNTTIWTVYTDEMLYSVDISYDGKYIVASGQRWVYLLNNSVPVKDKRYVWRYDYGTTDTNFYSELSDDGNYVLLAAGIDLYLFNNSYVGVSLSKDFIWNYVHVGSDFLCIAIDALGMYFAAGAQNGILYMFNRTTEKYMWNYTSPGEVQLLAISADGMYLAVVHDDTYTSLFNKTIVAMKTPMWTNTSIFYAQIMSLDISADGSKIVMGDNLGKLYLFDKTYSESKMALWVFDYGRGDLYCEISADGKYVLVWIAYVGSFFDQAVLLFNTTTTDPKLPCWEGHYWGGDPTFVAGSISYIGNYFVVAQRMPVSADWIYTYHNPVEPINDDEDDDDDDDEEDDPATEMNIPGYDVAILFIAIGLISFTIIKKHKKNC